MARRNSRNLLVYREYQVTYRVGPGGDLTTLSFSYTGKKGVFAGTYDDLLAHALRKYADELQLWRTELPLSFRTSQAWVLSPMVGPATRHPTTEALLRAFDTI